jgi:hypothetical protein
MVLAVFGVSEGGCGVDNNNVGDCGINNCCDVNAFSCLQI